METDPSRKVVRSPLPRSFTDLPPEAEISFPRLLRFYNLCKRRFRCHRVPALHYLRYPC